MRLFPSLRPTRVLVAPLAAILALASACGSPHEPRSSATASHAAPPPAAASSAAPPAAAALTSEPPGGFQSRFGRNHPLVGHIFSLARHAEVDPAAVATALAGARFVLLGEQHDNPDHHLLQAALVESLVASGRKPAVAFEMFEGPEQPRIDSYRASPGASADDLGHELDFEHSGWPPWANYAPIARVAFAAGLPILAANLPRSEVRALVHGASAGQNDAQLARLGISEPLPPALDASLRRELSASHCGQLPESMVGGMLAAQRARDANMAHVLIEGARKAGGTNGAVLIAGAGHARNDRGVPLYLRKSEPSASIAAVAFVEVDPQRADPFAYASRYDAAELPFDFVWFTPFASDEDPCAKFGGK